MATSMDVDRTPLDQQAALHELPQVSEPSIVHTGPPLSNGMRSPLVVARLAAFCTARLTVFNAQAPILENPSGKFPSRYTFGGPKETLGSTLGAPPSR
jgi:hypothetical protein